MKLAATTKRVNEQQHGRMVDKIQKVLGNVQGKTIGLLGLSFKPNTNDLRDSPALIIAEQLMMKGCKVRAHDPEGQEEALKAYPKLIGCQDAYDAAKGADALVLATEWNQFRNLDLDQLKEQMNHPIFIDLRNAYDPERITEKGFYYVSVGRSPAGQNPLKNPKKSLEGE
jgi:UDPglucose 6-dehydrogenase